MKEVRWTRDDMKIKSKHHVKKIYKYKNDAALLILTPNLTE